MTKIGFINCIFDSLIFDIILHCVPSWSQSGFRRLFVVFILIQFIAGRYQGKSLLFWDELKRIFLSHMWFYIIAFVSMIQYTNEQFIDLSIVVLFSLIIDIFLSRYTRIWFRKFIKKKVLVFGIGDTAHQLCLTIATNRFSTMEVQACVDVNRQLLSKETLVVQEDIIDIQDIEDYLKTHSIDTVIFAMPNIPNNHLKKLIHQVSFYVDEVKFLPQIDHSVNFNTKIDDFDGLIVISTSESRKISFIDRFLKRIIDICSGIVGVLLLLPLTLFVWILNRKEGDKGPIFFKQKRIGKDGKLFEIYKYRTMVVNAEEKLERLMAENPEIRKEYETFKKLENDPRVTKAGNILRSTSLDEFPQFINVLKGEMSLIGPRPYLPREKEDMLQYYDTIIQTKPGITGMWQTHGRSEVSFDERLELDDYYSHNWSLWLDITLLVRTFRTVMLKVGAH